AAVAFAETHYFVHAATNGRTNGAANVGQSCVACAASAARAKSAAKRAVAKEAVACCTRGAWHLRPPVEAAFANRNGARGVALRHGIRSTLRELDTLPR